MSSPAGQRFQESDVLRMFPSFAWKAELRGEISQPMNDAILRALGELGAPLAGLKPGESWQSDHGLHMQEPFRALVDCIDEAALSVLAYLEVAHGRIKVTGCWANVNAPGAGHRIHSHPNNYLSGVYYVAVPPPGSKIFFQDPRPSMIMPKPRQYSRLTANSANAESKEGRMLLFPAWLKHSVPSNQGQTDRISISFNLMFKSFAETMAAPMWDATAGKEE